MTEPALEREEMLEMCVTIVAAHVANNPVSQPELPKLLESVFATVEALANQEEIPEPEVLSPAVPVNRSIRPDYLVCLEDGRKLKSLKRHLRIAHGMSPEDYRERWSLKHDYPMTCSRTSARRTEIAHDIGLGRKPGSRKRRRKKK